MEALRSSESSFLTRVPRRHIPEDGILHSLCYENLKSNTEPLLISLLLEVCIDTKISVSEEECENYYLYAERSLQLPHYHLLK
jgi:hypothetical protein